jgi:hypothetical protein
MKEKRLSPEFHCVILYEVEIQKTKRRKPWNFQSHPCIEKGVEPAKKQNTKKSEKTIANIEMALEIEKPDTGDQRGWPNPKCQNDQNDRRMELEQQQIQKGFRGIRKSPSAEIR